MATSFVPAVHLLLTCLIKLASGSVIQFTNPVGIIRPLLTDKLTIRCSLEDTSAVVGRRAVQQTDTNVHVSTLVITRNNGDHVASVSQFFPAKAFVDQDNINVTGDVLGKPGYLEVTWSYPTQTQSGDYKCEANGIDELGHNVVFTKDLAIDVQQPGIAELVQYVHNLQVSNHGLTHENTGLKGEISSLKDDLLNLTSQLHSVVPSGNSNSVVHVENGTVACGDSDGWSDASGSRPHVEKVVTFSTPYKSPPVVHLSINMIDYYLKDASETNIDYNVQLVSVSDNRFTVKCDVYNSGRVDKLNVDWISFPGN